MLKFFLKYARGVEVKERSRVRAMCDALFGM